MAKTILLTAIFFLLLGLLFFSCKKDTMSAEAIVVDQGLIAADGCGWRLKINDIYYSADNLSDVFQIDGLKVRLSYRRIEKPFSCGQRVIAAPAQSGPGAYLIHITKIQRL